MRDPFFVVGTGRCGSTLLQAMLMSHPGVRMPPETQFFEHLDPGALGFGDVVRDGDEERYLCKALTERSRFFLNAVEGTADAYERAVHGGLRCAREQFLWVCDRLTAGQEGVWLGEKTPQHWKSIDRIVGLFPDARFVHLVRDPRDVVAGLLEMEWWPNKSCRRTAKHWRKAIDTALQGVRHDATRHMVVRYEDLVDRSETVLRSVGQFVGFGYDAAMLDHRASAGRAFHEGEAGYKARIHMAIDHSRIGRYRAKLSASEVRVVEATVGLDRMEQMGYGLDGEVNRPVWSPIEPVMTRAAESVGLGVRSAGRRR